MSPVPAPLALPAGRPDDAKARPEHAGPGRTWEAWLAANTPADWRPGEWDLVTRVFSGDVDNPATVIYQCPVAACPALSRTKGMCGGCQKDFRDLGQAAPDRRAFIAAHVPERNRAVDGLQERCAVAGCARGVAVWGVCAAHGSLRQKDLQRGRGMHLESWIAGATGYQAVPACRVVGCDRDGRIKSGLCDTHTRRSADDGLCDADDAWLDRQEPHLRTGQFSLAPLAPTARLELLFALAERDRRRQRLDPGAVRQAIALIADRVDSIARFGVQGLPKLGTANVAALLRETFRVVASGFDRFNGVDPASRAMLDLAEVGAKGVHGNPTTRPNLLDMTVVRQPWLRGMLAGFIAETTPATKDARLAHSAVAAASRALTARPGGGDDPAGLAFADMDAIVNRIRCAVGVEGDDLSDKQRKSLLTGFFKVLDWGRLTGRCDTMPAGFARHSTHVIKLVDDNEDMIGRAVPESVINQMDEHMDLLGAGVTHGVLTPGQVHEMSRCVYDLLLDTGRRPGEVGALGEDCLEMEDGEWLLRWDNSKGKRNRRRLPIPLETAASVHRWLKVRAQIDLPTGSERFLFPPAGESGHLRHLGADQIAPIIRAFADSVPELIGEFPGPDGAPLPFNRALIFPYAFRHSWAQRLADQEVPIDVLRDLMDHKSMETTKGYYKVTLKRKREAVNKVYRLGFGRHGEARPASSAQAFEVQSVAVVFGRCKEPTNVKRGGQACPIRFQCAGCGHFTPNPSDLPAIEEHIRELRQGRERALGMDVDKFVMDNMEANIAAMVKIADTAREMLEAMDPEEREEIEQAGAVLRKLRAGQAKKVFVDLTARPQRSAGG